jgi:phosphoribosylamine--glycine ligase
VSGLDVLVLGGGGREHALAWRLTHDDGVGKVRIAPGNGGTAAVAETVPELDPTKPRDVARHAGRERYDLVVIGPEAPLAGGVADALLQAGIPVFGPTRTAAQLETSKAFAKRQMERAGVPTPPARVFGDPEAALVHAQAEQAAGRHLVVKADWLAAGKGVQLPDSPEDTERAIRSLLETEGGGAQILLEERLEGREVSAFALVSGATVVPLAAACDYKRLGDGDAGPNTGGMGAYTPVPWFGADALDAMTATVFEPIAWQMARDGAPYRGVLYAGLMVTDDGPMVLEFNARFGDPEAQVLLPMLDGDLAGTLLGVATDDRGAMDGSLRARGGAAAVGVVVASQGYPEATELDRQLGGAEPSSAADDGDLLCFHAGTTRTANGYASSGGRVVCFVGRGSDFSAAREAAYRGVAGCELAGSQHRSDIALREVEEPVQPAPSA